MSSLCISEPDDNVVLVTAVGTVAAGHGCELWSTIESALEVAMGRPVVADLSKVTAFDADTTLALASVARACTRRRLDLYAVIPPNSRLGQYARTRGLERHLVIRPSLAAAISMVRTACHNNGSEFEE